MKNIIKMSNEKLSVLLNKEIEGILKKNSKVFKIVENKITLLSLTGKQANSKHMFSITREHNTTGTHYVSFLKKPGSKENNSQKSGTVPVNKIGTELMEWIEILRYYENGKEKENLLKKMVRILEFPSNKTQQKIILFAAVIATMWYILNMTGLI